MALELDAIGSVRRGYDHRDAAGISRRLFPRRVLLRSTGGLWEIIDARLAVPPSLRNRLMPWRRVAVSVRFGPRQQVNVRAIIALLAEVLNSESETNDVLRVPPKQVLQQFENADTPVDIIRIAKEIVGSA
jgi:hypothetical protein